MEERHFAFNPGIDKITIATYDDKNDWWVADIPESKTIVFWTTCEKDKFYGSSGKLAPSVSAGQSVHGFDGLNGARSRAGEWTRLCFRKSLFGRYPRPIRSRPRRSPIC